MEPPSPRTDGELLHAFLADRDAPCPSCGYNLRGLGGMACPECGAAVALDVRGAVAGVPSRRLVCAVLITAIVANVFFLVDYAIGMAPMITSLPPGMMAYYITSGVTFVLGTTLYAGLCAWGLIQLRKSAGGVDRPTRQEGTRRALLACLIIILVQAVEYVLILSFRYLLM